MTIRLYKSYDGMLCRTGRALRSFELGMKKARELSADGMVEVRELTSKGAEVLKAIFMGGVQIGQ